MPSNKFYLIRSCKNGNPAYTTMTCSEKTLLNVCISLDEDGNDFTVYRKLNNELIYFVGKPVNVAQVLLELAYRI